MMIPEVLFSAFVGAGTAIAAIGLWLLVRYRKDARGGESPTMLRDMQVGLLVLDEQAICVGTAGRLHDLLEVSGQWDPKGRSISSIIQEFAARGDYGPRIDPTKPVEAGLFRRRDFEDIYMDTPHGRILAVTVSRRFQGGWLLTFSDMTRMKEQARILARTQRDLAESEAKAKRLAEEADAANHAKSAFLASMSHEIRTPMNGVMGMAELLAETNLSVEQRTYVDTIGHSAEALLRIINDILDFSKIEAGRMSLDIANFNLLTAIEEVMMLVNANAREKDLDLCLVYDPKIPIGFSGDVFRIRQILINLVGNAIKFTPAGKVVIRVDAGDPGIEISVSDTGIGIPAADRERIFGEFDQVDRSQGRRFEGTGLGLAITKRLVDLMGGSINVTSTVGEGTCFTVSLNLPHADAGCVANVVEIPVRHLRVGLV